MNTAEPLGGAVEPLPGTSEFAAAVRARMAEKRRKDEHDPRGKPTFERKEEADCESELHRQEAARIEELVRALEEPINDGARSEWVRAGRVGPSPAQQRRALRQELNNLIVLHMKETWRRNGDERGRAIAAAATERLAAVRACLSEPDAPPREEDRQRRARWVLRRLLSQETTSPDVKEWATLARVQRLMRDRRL